MKIIKLLTTGVFLLFLMLNSCLFTHAQEYNSLLWQITGNELSDTSYLYGTMHTRKKEVHDLGRDAVDELLSCDAVALELIFDFDDNPMALIGVFKDMFMKNNITLEKLYADPKDYELVHKYAKENLGILGVILNVDKMKPIFIAMLVDVMKEESMALKNDTSLAKLSLDNWFQEIGAEEDKMLIGLETIDEQMNALDALSYEEQADMLLQQAKGETYGMDKGDVKDITYFYLDQDLDSMKMWYDNYAQYVPDAFDYAILKKRNQNMAERIDTSIHNHSTFVAVGALHLPGEKGVINLLRKMGYQLKPVSLKPKKVLLRKEGEGIKSED